MKFIEKELLNSHYYLLPNSRLRMNNKTYHTINPSFIHELLYQENTIYFTDDNRFLIMVEHNIPINSSFKKLYSYVIIDEYDYLMIQSPTWFSRFWNKPFLVTNPIYEYENNLYIFSNKLATPVLLTNDNLIQQITEAGAFSIGNGIIMALSLVALKKQSEKDFFKNLDSVCPKNNLFQIFTNKWTQYFYHNPCHLIDHLFRYAFSYNSPDIYNYLAHLTKPSPFVYHIYQRCSSSIFSLIKRKDQLSFAKIFITKYSSSTHTYIIDLYNLFKLKDFNYIKNILDLTNTKFSYILYVLNDMYTYANKKHLRHLWRFLLKQYQSVWSSTIETYLITQLFIFDTKNKKIPFIPNKFMRDFTYSTNFNYTSKWKEMYKLCYTILQTPDYNRSFEKRIIKRLDLLKRITKSYPQGHTIEFIMKDFYKDNKNLLFI